MCSISMFNIKREKHDYIYIIAGVGIALVFAEIVYLLVGCVISLAADLLGNYGAWIFAGSIICTIMLCIAIVSSILLEE